MGWVDYDRHARTCARGDLWGQVRRTVRGRPVAPEQIGMIVDEIVHRLDLRPRDVLLDLGCGNGALTARLMPACAGSVGVDISDYLVGIAQERFAVPGRDFMAQDAALFVEQAAEPEQFTKVLCYGSLGYLSDETVARMLRGVRRRFTNTSRVMLGNLADPARAAAFYPPDSPADLREARSPIGIWRDADEIAALAGSGWRLTKSVMPDEFFGAHYRYDAVLERVP